MNALCVNCIHYREPQSKWLSAEQYATCHHPRFLSLVTGKVDPSNCAVQRGSDNKDYCGSGAKFYECGKRIDEDDEDSALCGDEGRLCEECRDKEAAKHDYLRFSAAPEGSAEYERDMRDAGRAHLLR